VSVKPGGEARVNDGEGIVGGDVFGDDAEEPTCDDQRNGAER
jgi:hypothetical protein